MATWCLQESPEMFGKECFTSKGWSLDPWSKHGKNEPLPYDKFVMLYCKWLKIMAMMLVHMLKSGVYIQMRNALLVLQAIRKVIFFSSFFCYMPCPVRATLALIGRGAIFKASN